MRSGISLCVFTKPTENMNFPVRVYPTDKETLYVPVFKIFPESFHTTDRPEWIFLCVWLFPVSLSVTDKEMWISLWVAEKTRREIRHTQGISGFQ